MGISKNIELKKFIINKVPYFYAGSIGTFKKIVIDKLIYTIPLSSYNLFNYGYTQDDGITISIIHTIERMIGYLCFFIKSGLI